jgi:hypothetical protein
MDVTPAAPRGGGDMWSGSPVAALRREDAKPVSREPSRRDLGRLDRAG